MRSMIVDYSRHQGYIDWVQARLAGVGMAVGRATMGATGVDDMFATNWRATAKAAIARRGVYHYVVTGTTAADQAKNILAETGGDFGTEPLTIDCERTKAETDAVNSGQWVFPRAAYTAMVHDLIEILSAHVVVQIYTSKVEWEAITTLPAWAVDYPLWVAHYNQQVQKPDVPLGWAWRLWQYTDTGRVAGFATDVDLSRENEPVTEVNVSPAGARYGMHGESASQIIPFCTTAFNAGVPYAVVLGHENPGLGADAKDRGVETTIARWANPNKDFEGGQLVVNWGEAREDDFVAKAVQIIPDHTNAREYQGNDFFVPGYNEWDENNPDGSGAPYPEGYAVFGRIMCKLCREAARRSPGFEAQGLHPLRLALPGFNAGTPEYVEMQSFFGAQLDGLTLPQWMRRYGHRLLVHEGVAFGQSIDRGYGERLPGAPFVFNSGSLCLRVNVCQYVVQKMHGWGLPWTTGEFYDGEDKDSPIEARMAKLRWYDRHARLSPYFRDVAVFELTDDPKSDWWNWNWTRLFSAGLPLNDMLAERGKPNPTRDKSMDAEIKAQVVQAATEALTKAQGAAASAQAMLDAANAIPTGTTGAVGGSPLYQARVLANVKIRDAAGADTGRIITAGAQVVVYQEHQVIGGWQNRSVVNVNGDNITEVLANGSPALARQP